MLRKDLPTRINLTDGTGGGGPSTITVYANPIVAQTRINLGGDPGGVIVVPPVLWTPSVIDTDAWYSAKNSGTITLSSGAVSQWDDMSGNDRHATQSSGSFRPTYTTGQSIDFTESLFLNINVPQLSGQNVFAVVDTTNLGSDYRALLNRSAGGSPPYPPAPYLGGSSLNRKPLIYWGSTVFSVQTNAVQRLAIFRYSLESNQSTTAKTTSEVDGQNTFTQNLFGFFPLSSWVTINTGFSGQGSIMKIKELIITTSAEIGKITGYLAYEHGLMSSLPIDHPYKFTPPII